MPQQASIANATRSTLNIIEILKTQIQYIKIVGMLVLEDTVDGIGMIQT
jgi:hypothetical protein